MEDQTKGGSDGSTDGASGAYETEDGQLVLYDERNPDAYLRSDLTVDIER